MPFNLKTLTFNHDLGAATTSALNIRRNKDLETALPEYDSAIPRSAQEQCAAYAIAPTRNQAVFVRCVFELPGGTGFQVKATGGGVLGDLDAKAVGPSGLGIVTVDFPLSHRNFTAIGRHDVSWQWWVRQQEIGRHTSELQSHVNLVCRLLLEKKKKKKCSRFSQKKKKETITKKSTNKYTW